MHAAHHIHVMSKYKGAEFHLHNLQNTHNFILESILRPPLISMTTTHLEESHHTSGL